MPECKHIGICGLLDEADPIAGLCILHSKKAEKNIPEFDKALADHRATKGPNFSYMVFPALAHFTGETFHTNAEFNGVIFTKGAYFPSAIFDAEADFTGATFTEIAYFTGATFNAEADFNGARFTGRAIFNRVTFTHSALFWNATFTVEADFRSINIKQRLDNLRRKDSLRGAETTEIAVCLGNNSASHFEGSAIRQRKDTEGGGFISFSRTHFMKGAMFAGVQNSPIFTKGTEVDFSDVVLDSPDKLLFRHVDFQKCRFLNTDLRKVELTGVLWPNIRTRWRKNCSRLLKKGTRHVVYDEIFCYPPEESYPWNELERLYRELKQNYDERRNYPQVGNFHYGEKEMQKYNPATPGSLKVFLWLYWLVSGYGERFLRPLLCALMLLIGATIAYLWWGLTPKASPLSTKLETTTFLVLPGAQIREVPPAPAPHPLTQLNAWLNALHYSFRVMTLLKPEDLEPRGFAKVVQTLESLLGPLFLALFALAVRQRLKH